MKTNTLTVVEFQESRRWHEDGDENSGLEGPGYVYADCCHINSSGDGPCRKYYLTVENYSWCSDNLEHLERLLYFEFYLPEVAGYNYGD